MKSQPSSPANGSLAPEWAEKTMPRRLRIGEFPSIMLLQIPDEEFWSVATTGESDVIANPDSVLGRIFRPHAALLALVYLSTN
jgi:hypothetical protein